VEAKGGKSAMLRGEERKKREENAPSRESRRLEERVLDCGGQEVVAVSMEAVKATR
jgi:hypothetical protein